MKVSDEFPGDSEMVATLEAIDATLAGEAVDPRHAELAELALMLAADRPAIDPAFAVGLDERVQRRFAVAPRARRRRRSWWIWAPATGVAVPLIVAVAIVAGGSGSGTPSLRAGVNATGAPSAAASNTLFSKPKAAPAQRSLSPGGRGAVPAPATVVTHHHAAQTLSTLQQNGGSAGGASAPGETLTPALGNTTVASWANLQPPTSGRKVIQGAQLSLSTTSRRVDQVAQEVYNVVGQQNGIVKHSSVTATGGKGGYAQFQLSVPSSNLAPTMSALSNLSYAQVVSRTDNTQDVTNQYNFEQARLQDARALRTSLLKQLASAVTQAQIDSLTARIHDAEGTIASDQASLQSLQRQVSYSQIFVTLNSGAIPVPAHSGGGGLTLSKAAHDAGRVLTVAAGVALIGLAALLPVALVLALLWWVFSATRRRRRLQALDLY